MIARLEVTRGPLTEYPLAERVNGGWQNGVMFYPDADVTQVRPVTVDGATEWEWAGGFANFDGEWVADGEHYDNRDDAEFDVAEARAARMRSTLVRRRKAGPWEPVEDDS